MKSYYGPLALLLIPGIGHAGSIALSRVPQVLERLRSAGGRRALTMRLGRSVGDVPWDAFRRQIGLIDRGKVRVLVHGEEDYPAYLSDIADAPALLFCRGDHRMLGRRGVAVVGTRAASARARAFASQLAGDMVQRGWSVVSGGARGIDTAAHRGALDAGGTTVAVLGTGVDIPYPPENRALFDLIALSGCVVSDQLMGTPPLRHVFPVRNRLISGMGHAVVVVEAGQRSGALLTAQWALEQGREVGAVPAFPGDPRGRGCNALLRDGAFPVESVNDVAEAVPMLAAMTSPGAVRSGRVQARQNDAELSTEATTILGHLGAAPVDGDTLAAAVGLPVSAVQAALLELEIAGRVARDDTGSYHTV